MKPELLAPVGNLVMLKAALDSGTDAVYFGVKDLNMRANANNFELSQLSKIVKQCHDNGVRAYLTLNSIVYEEELSKLKIILRQAKKAKIDAIICWDHSVILEAKKLNLEIHLSTQASISNYDSLKFYYNLGVKRFVLARELSLKQIKQIKFKIIKNKLDAEIECFIHGAMCVAVSGRCFTSQFLYKKSANRGDCLQPCRRAYNVIDPETNKQLILQNNFVMSPKDLCTIPILDKLIKAKIDCFKIEGRIRSPEYVQTVTSTYKKLIDKKIITKKDKDAAINELEKVYHRKFHTGFYLGTPTNDDFTDLYGSSAKEQKLFLGMIKNYYSKVKAAEILIQAHELNIGDNIMVQGEKTGVIKTKVEQMEIDHEKVNKIKKGQRVGILLKQKVRKNDKVYLIRTV